MNDQTTNETKAALDAIRELMAGHIQEAADSADEDGAFSMAFRVRFNRSSVPTKNKVTCRVSKVTTDDSSGARKPTEGCPEGGTGGCRQIETLADDPDQGKLPL